MFHQWQYHMFSFPEGRKRLFTFLELWVVQQVIDFLPNYQVLH